MKFKYFVNEEKKVVVCKLDNKGTDYTEMGIGVKYIRSLIRKQPMPTYLDDLMYDLLSEKIMRNIKDAYPRDEQLVGIAKCDEHDTFDVQKGKDIARMRLEAKLMNQALNILSTLIDDTTRLGYKVCDHITTNLMKTSALTGQDEINRVSWMA